MSRKIIFLTLLLLFIFAGLAAAQSSSQFNLQRFVIVGGNQADSANYKVTMVFGQPLTTIGQSSNYTVSAGFLYPNQNSIYKVWLPLTIK